MLSFFKPADKSNEQQDNVDSKDSEVQVYTWSEGEKVGHVSLNIRGSYSSIWPKNIPAWGPAAIFPLKAALSKSLEADMDNESSSPSIEASDFSSCDAPVDFQKIYGTPVKPDKVYTIRGLDVEKMQIEQKRIEEGVAQEKIRYQLFPQLKTIHVLKKLALLQAHNPFSDNLEQNPKVPTQEPEQYNCASLSAHLLQVGGMSSFSSQSIWRPSTLSSILDKDPEAQVFRNNR